MIAALLGPALGEFGPLLSLATKWYGLLSPQARADVADALRSLKHDLPSSLERLANHAANFGLHEVAAGLSYSGVSLSELGVSTADQACSLEDEHFLAAFTPLFSLL